MVVAALWYCGAICDILGKRGLTGNILQSYEQAFSESSDEYGA
jgi:hypothetical protein